MNSWLPIIRYLFFLTLYRVSYEAANAASKPPDKSFLVELGPSPPIENQQQQAWSEKAIQKYAATQGKKWQRWNAAMFEKVK
jgi:hypothetical protein